MRKNNVILIIGILFINYTALNAQNIISSVLISPSNPTTDDSIYIYTNLQFASSSCYLDTSSIAVNGVIIYTSSHHCLGMLTTICQTTDTFKLAPLSAGTYQILSTLTSGSGGPPCIPGIIYDDMDTTTLTVINSTTHILNKEYDISFYPNPNNGRLNYSIINSEVFYDEIIIYSINGKIINSYSINGNKGHINVNLESGIYFIRLKDNKGNLSFVEKIVVK